MLLPVFYPGSNGVLVPAEIGWLPALAEGRLPGSYKFGAWYTTTPAVDDTFDANGNLVALTGQPGAQSQGQFGAYINFEQQLTRNSSEDSKGGLRVFLNAVMADWQTAKIDR